MIDGPFRGEVQATRTSAGLTGSSEKVMNFCVNSEHTPSRMGDDTCRDAASSSPKAGIVSSGAIQRTISKDGKYQIAESLARSCAKTSSNAERIRDLLTQS